MTVFDQKQVEFLRGNFTRIAERVGCSSFYVNRVVKGYVTRDTETTRAIKQIASQLLQIFQPTN